MRSRQRYRPCYLALDPVAPVEDPVDDPAVPEPSEAEVRAALAANGANIVRTAKALRLSSRYVLYRLMRRHGIDG